MTFTQSPGTGAPVFDYSSRDFTATLTDLLARQQVWLPEWTSTSNNDFGVVLLEIFSYVADILHYYIDRVANESFIQTATQPQSILNLAAMIGYTPYLSVGSNTTLTVGISNNMLVSQYPVYIQAGSQFATTGTQAQAPIPFVSLQDVWVNGLADATPTTASFYGAVPVVQGVQFNNEPVGISDGSINQVYRLKNNPVSANSVVLSVDLGQGPLPWTYVDTLLTAGPLAAVWTDYVDANQVFYIGLGDGTNGYVPPLGSPITASYMTNDGALGNVGPGTIVNYTGPPPGSSYPRPTGILTVTNNTQANGGAYAESASSIQANAPASLQTLNRGVTVSDIEVLASAVPGFVWASAVEETYQNINLYMCPNGGQQMSSLQQQEVSLKMANTVMANTLVNVLNASYIPVDITVTCYAYANFSNAAVTANVLFALQEMLAIPNTGFGYRLGLGLVYQTADSVPGVNWSVVNVLRREIMCTLTAPLLAGGQPGTTPQPYTSINVTQLPMSLSTGDQLFLINEATTPQVQLQVSVSSAQANNYFINTNPFTPPVTAAFPIGSTEFNVGSTIVQDESYLGDAVFLESEIPVAGVLTVNVIGGTQP